jgi:hypothetical protein
MCGAWESTLGPHTDTCAIDAALAAAGLDTPEKRDEARAMIEKARIAEEGR